MVQPSHPRQCSEDDSLIVVADVGGQHDEEGAWNVERCLNRRLSEHRRGNVLDSQTIGRPCQSFVVSPGDERRCPITDTGHKRPVEGNAPTHTAFRGDFPPGTVVGQEDQDITPGRMIAIVVSQRFHRRIPSGPQALLGGWECSDGISRGTEPVCGCSRGFRRPGVRMQLSEHAGSPRCGDLHAQPPRSEGGCGRIEPPVRLHRLGAHDHGTVHLPKARHVLAQPRECVTNTIWHIVPEPADLTIDRVAVGDGLGSGLRLILLDRARLPVSDSVA